MDDTVSINHTRKDPVFWMLPRVYAIRQRIKDSFVVGRYIDTRETVTIILDSAYVIVVGPKETVYVGRDVSRLIPRESRMFSNWGEYYAIWKDTDYEN
jgi:hypothetical protein